MANLPRPKDLTAAVGISRSHASEIVSGKATPSRSLAIQIYRTLGWRTNPIAGLSDAEIATLAKLEAKVAA